MIRTIFAAALALAAFGFTPGFIPVAQAHDSAYDNAAAKPHIDIPRIKSVLRLTPNQQAYWPPVERALRNLARQKLQERQPEQTEGLVRRVTNRVYEYALDAAALARIGAAVRPLVKVLDERQKQAAISLCQEMGLGQVLAALI
jgi:zinc resistance-associated protein